MQKIKLMPLKGFESFKRIFENGKKFYDVNSYTVFKFKSGEADKFTDIGKCYFGIAVSKRTSKSAVIRNRLKRILRVAVKQAFADTLSDKTGMNLESIIVSWKKAPKHPALIRLGDILPEIRNLFIKADDYYHKYSESIT
jgi:ribonuclease P protein component